METFFLYICEHMPTVIPIQTPVPSRNPGQRDVLGLTAPPMETVRIAVIGLGVRGRQAVTRLSHIPGSRISVLCDINPTANLTVDGAVCITDWREACSSPDVDLIYICTDWASHVPVALEAMDNGKHVAIEVPAAHTLEDIWALVDKAEQKRLHCMMLENSVYDSFERTAIQMARAGVFGEVVHAEGAYLHRIDFSLEPWRLEYNRAHRGDVYPTHGFGPVCQALSIHRTDHLQTLVSMDSAAHTGKALSADSSFANADQTTTLIRTSEGRTILLEHNVMTPRPYSRMFQIVGTSGYIAKYPVPQVCLLDPDGHEHIYEGEELETLMAGYAPEGIPEELREVALEVDARHGGMDYLMDWRLINALQQGLPLDMDVYDLAEWCAVAPLSSLSLSHGSAPVSFPDFIRK